jgi:hypothetical protein
LPPPCGLAARGSLRITAGGMRTSTLLLAAALAAAFFTGCRERGDQAIAYGDDLGQEWTPPAGAKQMRISVENYFTRDVVINADAPGVHYELTVGPIRKRHMIVPAADYKITAFTQERSTGMNYLYVTKDDRNGARALLVKIRF